VNSIVWGGGGAWGGPGGPGQECLSLLPSDHERVGLLFCQKEMGKGKNVNLFRENFYRKINLLIRDTVYTNALNMVFFCVWQILAIW
jgi:hypothetical protein